METPGAEDDSVRVAIDIPARDDVGRKKTEERTTGEDSSRSRSTVGSYLVDSLRNSVKSATGFLPASEGAEGDPAGREGSPDSGEVIDSEALPPVASVGDDRANEKCMEKELSPEGWSVVDPIPEDDYGDKAQLEVQSNRVEGEKETGKGVGVPGSSVAADPEMRDEDRYTIMSPSSSGYVADWPHFSYNDKPSSALRRRPRASAKGSKDDSPIVNSRDSKSSLHSEDGNMSAFPVKKTDSQSQPSSRSGVSGLTEGNKTELRNEDGDTVSEIDNGEPLTNKKKEAEFHSGYDPELEDDDNDASSVSSREPNNGGDAWKGKFPSLKEDAWEGLASSSDLEERGPILELRHGKEVYKAPSSDVVGEKADGEEAPTQLLHHPAGFIVRAVGFQVKIIIQMFSIAIWMLNYMLSTLSHPLNRTLAAKDKAAGIATEAVDQASGFISSVIDGLSQTGSAVSNLSRKTFWFLLNAAYVMSMLGLLLIPVIFLDFILVNRVVDNPLAMRQTLDFDYTQPRPVALFPLFSAKEMDRVKNLPPHKIVKARVIPSSHKFHITAVFTLPESEYNMNLGIFQVTAELVSARDQLLFRATKPCRLRFSSLPIRLMRSVIYTVPLFLGLTTETQKLEVRILEAQERAIPTAYVRILIEPRASYHDGGGIPDIFEASLLLESTPPWPGSIMGNYWKWTFYFWNGACLFLFELSIVFCCCRQLIVPSFGSQKGTQDRIVYGEVKDDNASRESSSSRTGRSKRQYNLNGKLTAADAHDPRSTWMLSTEEEADVAEGVIDDSDAGSSVHRSSGGDT